MDEIKETTGGLGEKLSRRSRREYVVKALYLAEFYPAGERDEQVRLFFTMEGLPEAIVEELMERYHFADAYRANADSLLMSEAKGWDLGRMGRTELAILRLAAAEICSDPDVPAAVAINEAVELAKKYGEAQAGSFVNGILGKVAKQYGQDDEK